MFRSFINVLPQSYPRDRDSSSKTRASVKVAAGCVAELMEPRLFLAGNGLAATYWDNASPTYSSSLNFSGPSVTRIDPTVNFNWGHGSPSPAIGPDTFSARWTGQIAIPTSGTYTFYATSDDGVKLWVNGVLIINNWRNQSATERSGSISLVGGQRYDLRMEYYENTGNAAAGLRWSGPGIAKAVVPQSVLYSTSLPAAPTNLAVAAISSSQASLTWTDNASNEGGFAISRSTDGATFVQIASTAANSTKYTDAGLADATIYYYRVAAYNAAGSSAYSAGSVATPLAAPTNLAVTAAANVPKVTLAWTSGSVSAQGYAIERSGDGANFSEIARVGTGVNTYTDAGSLSASTSYTYRVRAYGAAGTSAPSAAVAATTAAFTLYDGMLFNGEPDLSGYGLAKVYIAYSSIDPLMGSSGTQPDEVATRALARKVSALHQILCLDIESFATDLRGASAAQVQASMAALGQIVDWLHSERPDLKVGFYAVLPTWEYAAPVSGDPAGLQAWKNANAFLAPLAQKVDIIFPSLYTAYTDQNGWKTYAQANIEQARQYGKPVIPFLWMYYFNADATQANTPLPTSYWQMQLNVIRQYADGAVIWGGYQVPWDANAPWWTTTQSFMH